MLPNDVNDLLAFLLTNCVAQSTRYDKGYSPPKRIPNPTANHRAHALVWFVYFELGNLPFTLEFRFLYLPQFGLTYTKIVSYFMLDYTLYLSSNLIIISTLRLDWLLYNVPDNLFKGDFRQTYSGIVAFLRNANLKQFNSQNGERQLFGKSKDLWNVVDAQKFILALERMWNKWPNLN